MMKVRKRIDIFLSDIPYYIFENKLLMHKLGVINIVLCAIQ